MTSAPAWHQRFSVTRVPRQWARQTMFRALHAVGRTDDGRAVATSTLGDLLSWRPDLDASMVRTHAPYGDLGQASAVVAESARPVFITARFRSGSTLLWNLFRHVDGCTAYYEPLNERRWFDPTARGTNVDRTHRNVDDYWKEYDGLEVLGRYYRDNWIRRALYMDATSWDPALTAYVRTLVRSAPGRAVLQFNRIDFRLPWFRRTFPTAAIVHLYRHPRDQWCSTLPDWSACPSTATMTDFAANDHYYLLTWAADLKYRFPFLASPEIVHPYQLFYLIWKLSFWFGAHLAHHSLSFESLVDDPQTALSRLFEAMDISADVQRLRPLVAPTTRRWPGYAPDHWFRAHEQWGEDVLRDFFVSAGSPMAARIAGDRASGAVADRLSCCS